MATVPYSPVPQVSSSGQGLPQVSSSAPEAAFGGDIARAVSGLGKTVEGVGDQIYERALWLQNLNNQAEARKADADYIVRSGQLQTEYGALEGDAAVKAYPKYVQNMTALRESIKGSLPNRMTQEMFDGQTRTTLARSVFAASNHAAAAQKKYVIQSMDAQRTAIREEAARYPFDDMATERAVQRTEQSWDEEGRLRNLHPQVVDNAKREATSAIYASKIESAAKEYPLQGPTLLAGARDRLVEKDFKRVENIVNAQRDSYGLSKISLDLVSVNLNEDGSLKKPMEEIYADARRLAKEFSPDDPTFEQKVVRAVNSEYRTQSYAQTIERRQTSQAFYGVLNKGGISNKREFLDNPEGYAVYQSMTEKQRAKIDGQIYQFVTARDRQHNQETMTTLEGLRAREPDKFLDVDPTDKKLNLSQTNIATVARWQRQTMNEAEKNPEVNHALSLLRQNRPAELHALGIYSLTKSNQDDYDHFTGATQQAILAWKEAHGGKKPSDTQFNTEIAPILLKTKRQTWGDFFFGPPGPRNNSQPNIFTHDTGSKDFLKFKEERYDLADKRGLEQPTDFELYNLYSRKMYIELYQATKAKKDNAKP